MGLCVKPCGYHSESSAILSYLNLETSCLAFTNAVCLSGCPSSAREVWRKVGANAQPCGSTQPPGGPTQLCGSTQPLGCISEGT